MNVHQSTATIRPPTADSVYVRVAKDLLIESGVDPHEVLPKAGLAWPSSSDRGGITLRTEVAEVIRVCGIATGDESFALRHGRACQLRRLGVLGYAMLNTATVRDALECIRRYLPVLVEGTEIGIVANASDFNFIYQTVDETTEHERLATESALAFSMSMFNTLTGRQWNPCSVSFRHKRLADADRLELFFHAPVRFGQSRNALVLPAELLLAKVVNAEAELYEILEERLRDMLARRPVATDLLSGVRRQIAVALPRSHLTVEEVAGALLMSVRTLQRRLAQYGVSFNDLFDEVRRELADRHLRAPDLHLSEIAYLLGYADASAFNRACRRWFGTTPLVYRRESVDR